MAARIGFRVIFDLGNGVDRAIGPTRHETLGAAKASLIETLGQQAVQYAVFAVKEEKQATQDRALSFISAVTKVYDLKVGENLPLHNDHFYHIEEVELRD